MKPTTTYFSWDAYDHDIHIGKRSEPRRNVRDWAAEYKKRLKAGTANQVKTKKV